MPDPPSHNVPNIPASFEIAVRYSILNTIMAEFGIDLGGSRENSSDRNLHLNLAKNQKLPELVSATIKKIGNVQKLWHG